MLASCVQLGTEIAQDVTKCETVIFFKYKNSWKLSPPPKGKVKMKENCFLWVGISLKQKR